MHIAVGSVAALKELSPNTVAEIRDVTAPASYVLRVGRWSLAAALIATAACGDEPATTAPRATPQPRASVGSVITVTSTSDGTEPGTLRWATTQILSPEDVIRFDPSIAGDTINLTYGLDVMDPLTIEGPVPHGITIRGNGDRIMRARSGATLRNLTLTNGGGANGTAIWADGGAILLENTTVRDGFGNGAAILGADITLVNSTVSGNYGINAAAGIAYSWRLMLVNSTIAHNGPGAGIGQWGSPGLTPIATLRNSIVANNGVGSTTPKNCATAVGVSLLGLNISNDYSCGSSAAIYVADPMLLGLANNGGPSPTESFDHRSPALNAGVNCGVTTDQRYVARDAKCDIGAFEFTDFTVVTLTVDANTAVNANGSAVVTGTVKCSRAGDVFGVLVDLQQRKGTKTPVLIQGQGGAGVACTTTPQPWSAPITPSAGTFDSGNGTVTARTNDTSIWIKPAVVTKSVKLRK